MFTSLFDCCDYTGDESTAEPLLCVGRGMKLPPICDVPLPNAYYEELPVHVHTLSGIGRGHQLHGFGVNSNLEAVPGQRVFPEYAVPERSSFEAPMSSEDDDDFPELDRGNREDTVISEEKPVNRPQQPEASLKSLAAQFAKAK